VNVELFSQALAIFAEEAGVRPNKRIVLLLDRAGWHTSSKLTVPEGLHLVFLPAYSPEVPPAERLWPLSNEPLTNRAFASRRPPLNRCKWNAAAGYKPTLSSFALLPVSLGGYFLRILLNGLGRSALCECPVPRKQPKLSGKNMPPAKGVHITFQLAYYAFWGHSWIDGESILSFLIIL
jgi:transposase